MTITNLIQNDAIIGKIALEFFLQTGVAQVWGITSSGIFLGIQKSVLFLTNSPYFGPVNVVINKPLPSWWKKGDPVEMIKTGSILKFIHRSRQWVLQIKQIWETPEKPDFDIPSTEQLTRMLQATQQFNVLKNNEGFTSLLLPIIRQDRQIFLEDEWRVRSWETINLLKTALIQQNLDLSLHYASLLIGSGKGLTPSGDDLLTGLVFLRNRWFPQIKWLAAFEDQLSNYFKEKTTAVSATLFECARQGEADARIQEMCDVLMNSTIPFRQQVLELARWGNSSGADIFMGFLVGLLSFSNPM